MAERTHNVTATTGTEFEAGVYDDMPEGAYHAQNWALSSTGARKLLPPGCPARFAYEREHPPEPKDVFDLGTAAHSLVLGKGRPLAWLDAEDWRTKAAKEWRDATRAEGSVPLLRHEYEQVCAMAAAIREHPLANGLLADPAGAERSYFWQDGEFGIWRRARLDSSRHGTGRLIVTDYKTTASAEPGAFARSAVSYGYDQQAAWYLDAVAACLGEDAAFVFVAQEKAPPYLVSVFQPDDEMLRRGRARNARAMEIYRDCQAMDLWPGYQPDPTEIPWLSLPAWAAREDYL
jgi:PDDEXK-like uncharacterized protein DUF3799